MPTDVIHVARIQPKGDVVYLLLKKQGEHSYRWYEGDQETSVHGENPEVAMRKAKRFWQNVSYRTLNCGFRFTQPERDEHGGNALFHQMVASYSSSNGMYFDEELGNNCVVHEASQEALDYWRSLS